MNQSPAVEPIKVRSFNALVAVPEDVKYPADGSYVCHLTWRKGRMVISIGEQSQPTDQGASNGR